MQDAWRAYLELALGLTEASRKKAQTVAKKLVGQGGATAAQLQAVAEEMLATSAANREALRKLVRFEVDRALGVVGLATAEEVADLHARVRELERDLREARSAAAPAAVVSAVTDPGAGASIGEAALAEAMSEPVPEAIATKGVAWKAVAKKADARTATGKAVAKKAIAKKAVPEKAVTRRTAPTKAIAKKTTTRQVGAGGASPAAKSAVAKKAGKKQPPAAGMS